MSQGNVSTYHAFRLLSYWSNSFLRNSELIKIMIVNVIILQDAKPYKDIFKLLHFTFCFSLLNIKFTRERLAINWEANALRQFDGNVNNCVILIFLLKNVRNDVINSINYIFSWLFDTHLRMSNFKYSLLSLIMIWFTIWLLFSI